MADKQVSKIKEVKAFARYVHTSPRKLRLLADLVRNQYVDQALEQLKFSSKKAAIPLAKAINSAIANAVHNYDLKKQHLFIKQLTIDGGPVFKRYVPRAMGHSSMLRKRTSHINVVLGERERRKAGKRSIFSKYITPTRTSLEEKPQRVPEVETGKVESEKPKIRSMFVKPREKIKKNLVDLKRRLFNRKSGS